jgi:hypothetical protein
MWRQLTGVQLTVAMVIIHMSLSAVCIYFLKTVSDYPYSFVNLLHKWRSIRIAQVRNPDTLFSLFFHSQALIVQDWSLASLFGVSWSHTDRHTVGLLDEWSAHRRGLYLHRTTQHKHNRLTSMPRAGFEPSTPVTKRPQTYALDRAATGIGHFSLYSAFILIRGFVKNESRGSSVGIVSDYGLDDRAAVLKSMHTDRQTDTMCLHFVPIV